MDNRNNKKQNAKGTGKSQQAKRFASKKYAEKTGPDHITSGDIRRMARRGGVKRISAETYPTTKYICLLTLGMSLFSS